MCPLPARRRRGSLRSVYPLAPRRRENTHTSPQMLREMWTRTAVFRFSRIEGVNLCSEVNLEIVRSRLVGMMFIFTVPLTSLQVITSLIQFHVGRGGMTRVSALQASRVHMYLYFNFLHLNCTDFALRESYFLPYDLF